MTPFIREQLNPLVTPEMVKPSRPDFKVVCTFNAGVAEYKDEILLLLRVAEKPAVEEENNAEYLAVPTLEEQEDGTWDTQVKQLKLDDPRYDFSDPRKVYDREKETYAYLTSISHLRLARSRDGVHFTVDEKPFIKPDQELEGFGTEDARITKIGDTYYINYTAVSCNGITTALAETRDFVSVEKKGVIFVTENRDVTIFPEKINGKYYALTRPVPRQIGMAQMWIAQSPDLYHWGGHQLLKLPRFQWDGARNGGGAVPIRTEKGWLVLYHGADRESNRYCMNVALLDLENPEKVLAVGGKPVLEPEEEYETKGFYPNVVFSCGAFLRDNVIHMYYGAADRVMALARCELEDVWKWLNLEQ